MTFDFPIITLPGNLFAVLKKIREESHEVRRAILYQEPAERICEEIADLRQAVETLQRRATRAYGPLHMAKAEAFVIAKNRERSYYADLVRADLMIFPVSGAISVSVDPAKSREDATVFYSEGNEQ